MTQPGSSELLAVRGLTASFNVSGTRSCILDGVDFSISPGETVDIVGPSGSGKSTLVRALAWLLPDATGEFTWRGAPADMPVAEWRRHVTLVPQKTAIVAGTIRDNLTLPWKFKLRADADRPDDAILRAGLADVGLGAAELDRDAARLSVGQQARLALLRVLLTQPDVVLLDEADAALDDESSRLITEVVRRFVAADHLEWADPHCDRAAVRVRHRATDGLATRRLRMAEGLLDEVVA